MNDATCKLQSGLLMGNTISLGNFEECLMSKHPLNKFTGKYCLLNLQLNKLEQNQSFAWENLLKIAAGRNIDPRFKEEPQIVIWRKIIYVFIVNSINAVFFIYFLKIM